MMNVEVAKLSAARACLKLVEDAGIIGVGTGTTVEKFIALLSEREVFRSKLYVPSSLDTAAKLAAKGFRVLHPSSTTGVDVYVDGADEVDPSLNMIKGGGAALTMEKILAFYAKRRVFIVDFTKLVEKLGSKHPVPVEVLPPALNMVMEFLRSRGFKVRPRSSGKGKVGPVISDLGGVVVDVETGPIENPVELENVFRSMPGVVETGLFLGLADAVVVGWPDRYEIRVLQ